ncbi:helix-turn-helix domain-containing protein [Pectobacterium odoriferum]|uniref:helix-turn-helix domain-containing protein n=1 Tax=Pectobacterium odoriferum TaxID=78398 RepID=UPI000907AC30|nr:helix-turn-helix domain-containing protein [Pectobacterium odoriferum]
MKQTEATTAIKEACRVAGGQAALARFLGLSPPTINQWVMGVRPIPASQCPSIEKITEGAVTCEALRPDVDWAYLRGAEPKINSSAA